jgi:hypothetical protein
MGLVSISAKTLFGSRLEESLAGIIIIFILFGYNFTKKGQMMVDKIKEKVKNAKHLDEEKKSVILEKIEEWRHDREAVSLIPALLMKYYQEDIKPILDELGLTD